MNLEQALQRLQKFGYPAQEYHGLIDIEMGKQTEENKITREEIHAALDYQVPLENIRQINPWTVVITF